MMTPQSEEVEGGVIEYAEVLRRIPHRYPMLLIDRAIGYQPHEAIVGIKNVTFNEPFFQGHFPGAPVMPGVFLVEAMGQAGGLLISKSFDVDPTGKIIFFMSINEARFRKPVRPGDTVYMHVNVQKRRGMVYRFRGEAKVKGVVCAEAEFTAMMVEAADHE
jgi:3-hydroxyacyl-[acyl-carrier-protein] dehydratase